MGEKYFKNYLYKKPENQIFLFTNIIMENSKEKNCSRCNRQQIKF